MEWMYKEQKGNNVPNCMRNDLTPIESPVSNSADESSENELSENTVGSLHCPDLVEECMEGTSNPMGPPASSDSDVSSTTDIGYQHTSSASSMDGNTDDIFHSPYDMEFNKNEPSSMRTDAVPCADRTDNSQCSKAEKTKSLLEEVISYDLCFAFVLVS